MGLLALSVFLLMVNIGWLRNPFTAPPHLEQITSLAVLPLDNLSENPERRYLADGVTTAIIAELGKIAALRVISWQSVVQFKGSKASIPEIAYLLDVDALVVGCVQQAGDRIRVSTQLVAAEPEQQLWAESYEGKFGELLDMERRVARNVAREVHVVVTPEERSRLTDTGPVLPEAYDAYLKGLYDWNQFSKSSFYQAVEHFEEAVRLDPGYAVAHAALADVWSTLTWYGHVAPHDGFPKAEAAARRALEIDSSLAAAHNAMAGVLYSALLAVLGRRQIPSPGDPTEPELRPGPQLVFVVASQPGAPRGSSRGDPPRPSAESPVAVEQ
jgi:TolB-like protein